MKQSISKMVAMLLSMVIFFLPMVPLQVHATSNSVTLIDSVATTIQNTFPDSEIEIENGVISVFRPASSRNQQSRTTTTTIYAPQGGSWTNFSPPYYYYLQTPVNLPVLKTYLPFDQAKVLMTLLNEDGLFNYIISLNGVGLAADAIAQKVIESHGIVFTAAEIMIALSADIMSLYSRVNQTSFNRAFNASSTGKVVVEYTTCDGVPVNYYSPWESNYVDDSPWSDCSPVFQAGVYYQ